MSEIHPDEELRERALELARRISEMPRAAQVETKRRILLDAEHAFGDLFAEEERVFRETLLEIEPDPAGLGIGAFFFASLVTTRLIAHRTPRLTVAVRSQIGSSFR